MKRVKLWDYAGVASRPRMANCENCASFVSDAFVRVFAPQDRETVRVCPWCEDRVREGNETREARSSRR